MTFNRRLDRAEQALKVRGVISYRDVVMASRRGDLFNECPDGFKQNHLLNATGKPPDYYVIDGVCQFDDLIRLSDQGREIVIEWLIADGEHKRYRCDWLINSEDYQNRSINNG